MTALKPGSLRIMLMLATVVGFFLLFSYFYLFLDMKWMFYLVIAVVASILMMRKYIPRKPHQESTS
ncbi:MAG: hypothetical protein ACTSUE_13165 [Promethearchaeota archaeon]